MIKIPELKVNILTDNLLKRLIKEEYGIKNSDINETIYAPVNREKIYKIEKERLDNIKNAQLNEFILGDNNFIFVKTLLTDMCNRNIISEGNYFLGTIN